ncbi:MAG TPA: SGNH/GDSL hydrolase family protein, partial [Candidatus Margulisiibacteriota bacterium]|nr:SGNH/GDSL hydrolase family protein [Candidatus Margulisiibacteriota bacterium]
MRIPLKNILLNTSLVFISLLFFIFLFEQILQSGFLNILDPSSTILAARRYKRIAREINLRNREFSNKNRFGFNDREREVNKKSGSYRIAVVGDSYVWGVGLAYDDIWSHKLENRLVKYSDKLEVLSWGRPGWSTRNEFDFLKGEGVKYGINLLIVSFCVNDPDMGDFRVKYFSLREQKVIAPLKRFIPTALEFMDGALDSVMGRFSKDWGNRNWVEKLYTDVNLAKYDNLLAEFSDFCNTRQISLLFVLFPDNYDPYYEAKFKKVKPLLEKNHIEYLDLYPVVARDLSKY